jgi:hypothetical protein
MKFFKDRRNVDIALYSGVAIIFIVLLISKINKYINHIKVSEIRIFLNVIIILGTSYRLFNLIKDKKQNP